MKKMVCLGMAAVLAASLTACGGNGAETAETAKTAESNTAGEAASEGAAFKIGVIGPLTGQTAAYGNAVAHGAELAVKEINEAGGINGYPVELNAQDDENDTQKTVNAYNILKDWGVQMLVGATTSGCSIAVSAETFNDNMFQLTPSGSAVDCIANPNVFRVCFSDPEQGTLSAKYIGEHKLGTKIGILYDSSDPYSSGLRESFIAESGNQGLEVVADEAFTADTATDFSVQLDKMKDAGAELVYLPIYYQEASIILKQANDKGFAPQFFGCDGMDGILSIENFDTSLAEGLMLLTPFSTVEESSKKFTADFVAAYGDEPNQFAADAYDAVYAIKAAAEAKNVTPDMSVSDICEAMKVGMTEITMDGLTGVGMTWDASGAPTKEPKAVRIENSVYVAQ